MESQNAEAETGTRGTASVSRWSPTKEQINILENLYKQGIRTPNAEQIQHITCSLRAYGHIEGKNVFYWFQNHKARQRQKLKQKQQTAVAYFNRFLHTSHPISSSPLCQNVVCAPYCFQQSGIGFYPQQSKMIAAGDISLRSEQVESLGMPKFCNGQQIYEQLQQRVTDCNFRSSNKKTLTLFPLHPTGIMDGKTTNQMPSLASISDVDEDGPPGNQPFFDFLTSEQRS